MTTRKLLSRAATASAAFLCIAAMALGQGGEHGASLSQVTRLNRAPVSRQALEVHLPKPVVKTLPNGLKVVILEQHKLPTVNFLLWIEAGELSDPKDMPGLAGFTAEMLREGTTHRSSAQIADSVANIGGSLDTSARFGSTIASVSMSGLAPSAGALLDIMSDLVLNPAFAPDELDKYKQRQLSELEQARSEPTVLAQEKFHQVLYQSFPAAVYLPTVESIQAATPDRLRAFYHQYYTPSNAMLGIVGDVKADEVLALVSQYFGSWSGPAAPKQDWSHLPPPAPARIYLVDRPGSVQTNIVAGNYGARRVDADYIPLYVMNRVVGGGPQARLFLNLREAHGYTYGAYSSLGDDRYPEPWAANTEVRNAVTDGSMHELTGELKRIRDQKVPDQELDEARHSIVASFALSLEQPQQTLFRWMLVESYGLPADYWDRFPVQVAATSADAVQAAARKYIDLDHLQIVCVGDAKQAGNEDKQSVRDVLAKYGTLEVYDTNGKREN